MDYIYILIDPRNNQIRYVGKTDNPERRLAMHLKDKDKCHRVNWIKGLLVDGFEPILKIIEIVAQNSNWEDRERYWIAHYRSAGCNLTNMTNGGDQGPDCTGKKIIHSEQGRKNIIAALIKRNKSPEGRETSRRNGLMNKGRKQSPETIEKIRKASTGRKITLSDKAKNRLIKRNKTQKYNSEKMSNNAKKLWDDPVKGKEMRKKLAERNKTDKMKEAGKKRVFNSERMRNNSRKLWDDPIKGPELRAKLAERNKARKKHKDDS